jgi:hypothetical protein
LPRGWGKKFTANVSTHLFYHGHNNSAVLRHNISRGYTTYPARFQCPVLAYIKAIIHIRAGSFDMIKPMYERTAMEDFRFYTIIILKLSIFEPARITIDLR